MAPAAAAGPGPGREREGPWASLVPAGLDGLRARAQAAAAEAEEAGAGGLAVRGGLPRFAAKARAAAAGGGGRRPRVCYCGGSITAQRAGWRPALHGWLEHTFPCPGGFVDLPAFMGNVGSTVLSFLVEDWIVEGEPDLVFLETAVNDGDYLLESGDAQGLGRAVEGIVRQLKTALPDCEIVLVFNFLRTYMPVARRTGTQAWADGHLTEAEYAGLYHRAAPQLLSAVAAKYDLPTISTIPFFNAVGRGGHDALFRDDCHHTEAGGRLAASLVAEGLLACFGGAGVGDLPAAPTLPAPIDPQNWSAGKATLVDEGMVAFGGGARGGKRRADRDPITGGALDWWTLDPGDTVTVVFDGSGFGVITHIGPDSGTLRYCIERLGRKGKDSATVRREGTKALFDEWAYYYRLQCVLLATDLPLGTYRVTISLAAAVPDRSVARRPVPPESGQLKLWVSHAVVVGTWCGAHRALPAPPARPQATAPQTAAPAWVAPLRSE